MGDNVRWKEPVDLTDIDATADAMEEEHKILNRLRFLIIRGPAGVGKTYGGLVWAKQNKYDVFIQECSGDMGYYDMIGSNMFDGKGGAIYNAGVVASAVHNASEGKPTLLVLDEINMLPQTVLKEVGSLFDFRQAVETPIGRMTAKKEMNPDGSVKTFYLKIIGTANSEAESAGFELDVALQSRAMIVTLEAKEMARRLKKAQLADDASCRLIGETNGVFSLREIEQVQALSQEFGPEKAMKLVVNKYTNPERQKLVRNAVMMVFGPEAGSKMV